MKHGDWNDMVSFTVSGWAADWTNNEVSWTVIASTIPKEC